MLVSVVAVPISAVPAVTPSRRVARQAGADKDGGRSRRGPTARSERLDANDAPSSDPAASRSSVSVLSALLDLPHGG